MFLLYSYFINNSNFWQVYLRVVLETYAFLKGRQDNKWCSLKSLTFQTGQKNWDGGSIFFVPIPTYS